METTLRSTSFGRSSGRQLPFSTRLANLLDVPPVFRKTVARLLEGREQRVRHILYTPEFGTFGEYCPATLFIVTDQEWLAFAAEKSGTPTVCYADFSQTRLIEFTLALLEGRVALEYGEAGEQACILRFSLTSWDVFRDALSMILSNGAQISSEELLSRTLPPECEKLSFGMRSTLQEALMPNDPLCELIAWTRAEIVESGNQPMIHPGGLVLTQHFLMIVSAEDPSERGAQFHMSDYSRGVVFLRRSYPIVGRTISYEGIDELEITAASETQASNVTVRIPRGLSAKISRMLSPLGVAEKS